MDAKARKSFEPFLYLYNHGALPLAFLSFLKIISYHNHTCSVTEPQLFRKTCLSRACWYEMPLNLFHPINKCSFNNRRIKLEGDGKKGKEAVKWKLWKIDSAYHASTKRSYVRSGMRQITTFEYFVAREKKPIDSKHLMDDTRIHTYAFFYCTSYTYSNSQDKERKKRRSFTEWKLVIFVVIEFTLPHFYENGRCFMVILWVWLWLCAHHKFNSIICMMRALITGVKWTLEKTLSLSLCVLRELQLWLYLSFSFLTFSLASIFGMMQLIKSNQFGNSYARDMPTFFARLIPLVRLLKS